MTSVRPESRLDGLRVAATHGIEYVDLCFFGENDFRSVPESRAREQLMRCADETLDSIVQDVRTAERERGTLLSFPAFATNFPNISDPFRQELRERGLIQLACTLILAHMMEVGVVEIVCGRRVTHIRTNGDHHISHPLDKETLAKIRECFVESVSTAYELAHAALYDEPDVAIALEIEPGAAFLAGNIEEAAELLADLRARMPSRSDKFGLNVDMGHMLLVYPEITKANDVRKLLLTRLADGNTGKEIPLTQLVMHAHISDHVEGHFADGPVGAFHDLSDFLGWLEQYRAIGQDPVRSAYYTSTVAIELEASENIADVLRAYSAVRYLMMKELGAAATPRIAKKRAAVMFADIRSSTDLSIQAADELAAEIMTEFYREMSDCVRDHGGRVDKFIGDCVMALFVEADRSKNSVEKRALACAKEMVKRFDKRCLTWTERIQQRWGGAPRPLLCVGINSGEAMVGDFGPPGTRAWTAIGPTVIVAERICELGNEKHRIVYTQAVKSGAEDEEGKLWKRNAAPLKGCRSFKTNLYSLPPSVQE